MHPTAPDSAAWWTDQPRWLRVLTLSLAAAVALAVYWLTGAGQNGLCYAGSTLLTTELITREALAVLENALTFARLVNREYENKFAIEGAKIGSVVNVRKPVRYVVKKGQALQLQDATETSVPVALTEQAQVAFQFSSLDLTLSIDDFSKRFIQPAVASIANQIDADGLALYNQIANVVGTPGTTPNALLTYLLAGVKLDDEAAPQDEQRSIVINPLMQATIVDALKGLFQQASEIASQYRKGQMGTAAGFNWYMDQNVASHTVGPLGGTPLVNGASQTGASIVTDGWTAAAANRVLKGDVLQFASVNAVNPQSRASTGSLRDVVVTADTASDGSGNATIPIDPPITTSGAFQTVTKSPADNAAITIFSSASAHADKVSPQGMAFHRDAFTLVTADLVVPRGTDMASRVASKKLGLSIRMIRDYDINTDQFPCRLDVLYGWAALRKELASRIAA